MKSNEYGKFIRAVRRERGETLNTMSAKLGVSIAFLSALEVGKKTIPLFYVDKISEIYGFNEAQKRELANVIDLSNSRIVIQLADLDEEKKNLALAFARNIEKYTSEDIKKLFEIVEA